MTDGTTLQAVVDRQVITDLIYRYCRAMDRTDAELGYTIWHEDGLAARRSSKWLDLVKWGWSATQGLIRMAHTF